jgi:hypothetical protein
VGFFLGVVDLWWWVCVWGVCLCVCVCVWCVFVCVWCVFVCVLCVDKVSNYKVTMSGKHRSLSKQDAVNRVTV